MPYFKLTRYLGPQPLANGVEFNFNLLASFLSGV